MILVLVVGGDGGDSDVSDSAARAAVVEPNAEAITRLDAVEERSPETKRLLLCCSLNQVMRFDDSVVSDSSSSLVAAVSADADAVVAVFVVVIIPAKDPTRTSETTCPPLVENP
jgi:hypothetical protein